MTLTKMDQIKEIGRRIKSAKRVLVISHIRPDGDAIGSLLGLGLGLQLIGKETQLVLADGLPQRFAFLEHSHEINVRKNGEFDTIIVVDVSDIDRVGPVLNGSVKPTINIDHHVTNLGFAEYNLVNTSAVATAEVIADNLARWGLPLTRPIAQALLTGIVTDTLGFKTPNVTPKALHSAAVLVEAGADLAQIYENTLVNRSYEAIKYWSRGLSTLTRQEDLVWTTLTIADRDEVSYPGNDDADLINILSAIRDANVAVIFIEQTDGTVKVSWRARPGIDVSSIAFSYGGGGHPAASGATIRGSLSAVREDVLRETMKLLQIKELSRNLVDGKEK